MAEKEQKSGRAVTSYDVARHAGVSQSAVSRSFTPGGYVSKATRAKIKKAIDALGYRPNAIARSLITQRSNMVAIIVANFGFHPEFTTYLNRGLNERGLRVLLFTLDHEHEADHVIDQIWQYRVDGVIAAVNLPRQHVAMLVDRNTPVVFLNRYSDFPINSVACDQAEGERLLVDRLAAAGHKRFAIIQGPDDSTVSQQRVEEALQRLEKAGIRDVVLARGNFDYKSGKRALHEIVCQAGRAPDAVICANDMMALGCMDAARHDLQLRVPDDISVVGFDGLSQAYWSSYDLVTIRQPVKAMVDAAIDMLMARVQDPTLGPEKRTFSGELVLGSSARMS